MTRHKDIDKMELFSKLRRGELIYGGNSRLMIYGKLNCASGKRMKKTNRVFFNTESEALGLGYRPCGNCLRDNYKIFKNGSV